MFRFFVFVALLAGCIADLRMASQPKNGWRAQSRGKVKFVPEYSLYMEPSTFGYAGLVKQRDERAYDNFLRSNIDNEQDKRNFDTEDGKDHLPFRSYETASNDIHQSVKRKIPNDSPGPAMTVTVGESYTVPLRWNNPHASELEVNIWIMRNNKPIVVPIRKPCCSAEGYQDNVFKFTVPESFSTLGQKIPGFEGCTKPNDCVLQIYAHSVESRTYAMGTPLIVKKSKSGADIAPALANLATEPRAHDDDVGTGAGYRDLRPLCRPSNDPGADITTLVPRQPRLVSDVFNHAYQNSDFSPYSGQQPTEISQNMQAAAILKMTVGNRGELGKKYMRSTKELREAANYAKKLDKKARNLIKVYEGVTNQFIASIGQEMNTTDSWDVAQPDGTGKQSTNDCFRCAIVGSTSTRRLTTNTYVPSFRIGSKALLEKAKQYLAPVYGNLIQVKDSGKNSEHGNLGIYNAVLEDLNEEFTAIGENHGYHYLPAVLKTTLTTKKDQTNFKKIGANGQKDGGLYAATQVQDDIKNFGVKVGKNTVPRYGTNLNEASCPGVGTDGLAVLIAGEDEALLSNDQNDPNALYADADCDDDALVAKNPDMACLRPGHDQLSPGQIFAGEGQVTDEDGPASSASTAGLSAFSALVVVLCMYFQ